MSATKSDVFQEVYDKLTVWVKDVQQHELIEMVEFVEKAKQYAKSADALREEKVNQFVENLSLDLAEFHLQWQKDSKNSIYLGLLNEAWWQTLSEMTDKSQVEWAELMDDFKHKGVYHTGDYIGFGELECLNCKSHLHITHFSELGECAECGHNQFERKPLAP